MKNFFSKISTFCNSDFQNLQFDFQNLQNLLFIGAGYALKKKRDM